VPDPRTPRGEPGSRPGSRPSGRDQPNANARAAGLCNRCLFRRDIVSDRGSIFIMCERAAEDHRYVRYPTLPVWRCPGFEFRVDG
jgi:hypothetical protein